jgi:hypothetical protein
MKPVTQTAKTDDKPTSTAYIPYTQKHLADSAECWSNTTSKVSSYHLGKYSATFLLSKMHWD